MIFVYADFFEKLFDAVLAEPGIFEKSKTLLQRLCSCIGLLHFHSESVEKILLGIHATFEKDWSLAT